MRFIYSEYGVEIESAGKKDSTKDEVCFRAGEKEFRLENDLKYQPNGLKTVSGTLGIKKSGKVDCTAVILPAAGPAAAVFTKSLCPSVTILRGREILKHGKLRALLVNSGNANVYTPTGAEDLDEIVSLASKEFGCQPEELLVCSTGVIGVPLPMEKFRAGIPGLRSGLQENALEKAAEAILTTDLGPKTSSFRHGEWTLSAIAKGAGMIEPNLATLLVYFFTDVKLSPKILQGQLRSAVVASFNSLSVDSDMSTSDSVALFSTGAIPLREDEQEIFAAALRAMAIKLSRDIASQGEGVSKLIECVLETDISQDFAQRTAKLIINSPLVKTAIHGGDPNWGRIVAAIGKADAEAPYSPSAISIQLMGTSVFEGGGAVPIDLAALRASMHSASVVTIHVRIGEPRYRARVWGADLTEEYVTFNSDYTS